RSCDRAVRPEALYASPNGLAPHYSRFRVAERLLLTGHSHQAWPDAGFEAQQRAWLDAAECLDEKWERAFAQAERVRRGFARLLDDSDGTIALGANTHELIVRWLSALPLGQRPRLVTTTAEFHTIRRQLDRLAEEGIAVARVPGLPAATLAERLARTVDDRTSHYRAAAVFEFFERQDLTPTLLREVSQHQVRLLARLFDDLDLDPAVMSRDRSVPIDRIGGFLALQCPRAEALSHRLRHDG